jgi:hypothetical protein
VGNNIPNNGTKYKNKRKNKNNKIISTKTNQYYWKKVI